jgi:uncharacterized protein (DUF2147 family)
VRFNIRRSRVIAVLALVALGPYRSAAAQGASPVGRWRTFDDKTNQAKSIVEIFSAGDELRGRVTKVFAPPARSPNPVCEDCPGEFKDKPIVGMQVMWGLKKDGTEYSGGRVFDPENRKTYRCRLLVIDGGKKLELRGFIGFSLIGRTQTWVRES